MIELAVLLVAVLFLPPLICAGLFAGIYRARAAPEKRTAWKTVIWGLLGGILGASPVLVLLLSYQG